MFKKAAGRSNRERDSEVKVPKLGGSAVEVEESMLRHNFYKNIPMTRKKEAMFFFDLILIQQHTPP